MDVMEVLQTVLTSGYLPMRPVLNSPIHMKLKIAPEKNALKLLVKQKDARLLQDTMKQH